MNYCYSDFLFMGPIETRTVSELLFGYTQQTIADRINTGDVNDGNIYYKADVHPVFLNGAETTSTSFSTSSVGYTVSSGNVDMNTAGQLEASAFNSAYDETRLDWQNNEEYIWDGVEWFTVPFFSLATAGPALFGSWDATLPYQAFPADSESLWQRWDPRFPNTNGQYVLSQAEGTPTCVDVVEPTEPDECETV